MTDDLRPKHQHTSHLRVQLRAPAGDAGQETSRDVEPLAGDRTIILGIPLWLYEHLSRFMQDHGLHTITELIVHVLAGPGGAPSGLSGSHYSEQELSVIRGLLQTNRFSVGSLPGLGSYGSASGSAARVPGDAALRRGEE
jgi:hypothetical protein